MLDEEAVEQAEGIEGEAADDPGPREGDHLAADPPVDAPRQIGHVLPQRDHERDSDRGERRDQDPLDVRCQTATRRTLKTIWVSPRVSE